LPKRKHGPAHAGGDAEIAFSAVLIAAGLPNASVISQQAMKAEGEEAFAEKPVGSGAFSVKEWLRGEKSCW
jgi:ABC-type oligopeptide transport system substrate-binding subunit